MKLSSGRVLLLIISLLTSTLFVYPQQQQDPPDQPIKLGTELVALDALILNKKTGALINGLTKDDFTIYEDGVKQLITHFSQDKLPLSIVLLLDVSGSVGPIINEVRDEGIKALQQLRPDDEVAVMAFGKWATVIQDFTKDRQLIMKGIGTIEWMGNWIREGTYINEAVYQAAKHLSKASNPDNRRALIIVTDNITNQLPGLGHSKSEALDELLESGAVLSGLMVGDFQATVSEYQKKGYLLTDSIGSYASETGGVIVQVEKSDAVEKLGRIIERLRARYSFGYTPLNGKRDGKFRKIRLKMASGVEKREGEITIITRKGYYARGQSGK
jgi:Ca-activated chloride channel homolog